MFSQICYFTDCDVIHLMQTVLVVEVSSAKPEETIDLRRITFQLPHMELNSRQRLRPVIHEQSSLSTWHPRPVYWLISKSAQKKTLIYKTYTTDFRVQTQLSHTFFRFSWQIVHKLSTKTTKTSNHDCITRYILPTVRNHWLVTCHSATRWHATKWQGK